MGDIYHYDEASGKGIVYAGSVPIDDTQASDKSTWSSQKINNTKADQTAIAPVENGTTASRAYAIGENFMKDGAFCTAIAAIAQGAIFTLNTNYTAGTVGARVAEMNEVQTDTSISGVTIYKLGKLRELHTQNLSLTASEKLQLPSDSIPRMSTFVAGIDASDNLIRMSIAQGKLYAANGAGGQIACNKINVTFVYIAQD